MKEQIASYMVKMARSTSLKRMIKLTGQEVVFPFYHTVSEEALPHISHLYRVRTTAEFERDLDMLLKEYEPISMTAYLEQQGRVRGKRGMVLTFDDGLKECHSIIAPLLKKKGIPAVFFLNNRFIDNHGLFYRYKASLIIHQAREDCRVMEKISAFLKIPQEHVEKSIRMIGPRQVSLLAKLAEEAGLDYSAYLRDFSPYMDSEAIKQVLDWGFDIGGHSMDHYNFASLSSREMLDQVRDSIDDLQKRFGISTRYFSFPFTSDGVPGSVINRLLDENTAAVLMGTAGLKRTGRKEYIQRIPMENQHFTALESLQAEYLYYLLKMPLGKNRLRY